MFTLPPLPPKDYVLKDVNQNTRSCQEFTPLALPRITQSNLAKFCYPIQYQDNEKFQRSDLVGTNPQLLERWTDNARAFWVDKPGKNDYFLHDMFKKYTVQVEPSYDSRYKHNERVFYRSFKYELDCFEYKRLKKLEAKMERHKNEEREKKKMKEVKAIAHTEKLKNKPCKGWPPFWWKEEEKETPCGGLPEEPTGPEVVLEKTRMRWWDEPNLTEFVKADPCKRRLDMALVDLPFRNEACNWYYQNYPPPNIRFVHKRFA